MAVPRALAEAAAAAASAAGSRALRPARTHCVWDDVLGRRRARARLLLSAAGFAAATRETDPRALSAREIDAPLADHSAVAVGEAREVSPELTSLKDAAVRRVFEGRAEERRVGEERSSRWAPALR